MALLALLCAASFFAPLGVLGAKRVPCEKRLLRFFFALRYTGADAFALGTRRLRQNLPYPRSFPPVPERGPLQHPPPRAHRHHGAAPPKPPRPRRLRIPRQPHPNPLPHGLRLANTRAHLWYGCLPRPPESRGALRARAAPPRRPHPSPRRRRSPPRPPRAPPRHGTNRAAFPLSPGAPRARRRQGAR